MDTYIFIGPTISEAEAKNYLDAVYMPPVSQGDIVSLLKKQPRIIGIIDGYFENVPSVWHKEILLALSRGIHVVGASSMGALRAAELHAFGMVGIGEIFEWYRDGLIEADDEVAVSHAPEEHNYTPLSGAMVNIRKTLQLACDNGIISRSTMESLISLGTKMHFYDRSYQGILNKAAGNGMPEKEISALRKYLAQNTVDQKKIDAIKALEYIRELKKNEHPFKGDFELQSTIYLKRLIDDERRLADFDGMRLTTQKIANPVRLECDDFIELKNNATKNNKIIPFARYLGITVSDEELQMGADYFRQLFNLHKKEDVIEWIKRNNLTEDEFERFIEEWVLLGKMQFL